LPTDLSHANKKVHLIMQHNPSYAYADLSLKEAVLLFHDNKLTCLPIVDDKLRPIGIITWRDIIGLLAKQYRLKNATDNTA
jgi:acetoin utilization protein AcuB